MTIALDRLRDVGRMYGLRQDQTGLHAVAQTLERVLRPACPDRVETVALEVLHEPVESSRVVIDDQYRMEVGLGRHRPPRR